jgi:hypothetical protein
MSEEEFDHLAKDLKQIVDPRVVLIAEQVTMAENPGGWVSARRS